MRIRGRSIAEYFIKGQVMVMNLIELGFPEKKVNSLNKRGITDDIDLVRFFPRKIYDFSSPEPLMPENHGKYIAVYGNAYHVGTKKTNQTLMIQVKIIDQLSGHKLHISIIGQYFLWDRIKEWKDQTVYACGKLEYNEDFHSYCMNNPVLISNRAEDCLKIHRIHTKFSGISEEYMVEKIKKAYQEADLTDYIPEQILSRFGLPNFKDTVWIMHNANTMGLINKAEKRIVFEQLLYYACKIEINNRKVSKGTPYNLKSVKCMNQVINDLPYDLTQDQKRTLDDFLDKLRDGRRVNALVQGDVGCGKTIVAILMMFAAADSGYQSVLVAPTAILAKQHYEELNGYAAKFGYKVAYLGGKMKVSEKKAIKQGIKDGEYQFIVGTHSALYIDYCNLALTITDEEHKFGSIQKNILVEKSMLGMHSVMMSATPIPLTLANVIYGKNTEVFTIKTLPNGRQPVQTAVCGKQETILEFAKKQIQAGHQVYVVCPLIVKDEDCEATSKLESVEETEASYRNYFSGTGVEIVTVTGKTPAEEQEESFRRFKSNEVQILISTTVIEVGINVPNATLIVINNAERFGMAGLHQLRGRVGRGSNKAYCILKSQERDNMRLQAMCKSTDGFELAKIDMEQRGMGDIIGTEQSGFNKYVKLMFEYPNMFQKAQEIAISIVDSGEADRFVNDFEDRILKMSDSDK